MKKYNSDDHLVMLTIGTERELQKFREQGQNEIRGMWMGTKKKLKFWGPIFLILLEASRKQNTLNLLGKEFLSDRLS